jgi:hypothetical protein
MNLPQARSSELVVNELGKELLIYDLKTNKAFQLNETSMIVFHACNGTTTFNELKRRHKFTDDLIRFALDELAAHDLLKAYDSNHFGSLSRREIVRKVGLATMIALPVIAGITAPAAAAAASLTPCQRNNCIDGQGPPVTNRTGCNPPAGCGALGSVCCAINDTCSCASVAVCRQFNGQVCSSLV